MSKKNILIRCSGGVSQKALNLFDKEKYSVSFAKKASKNEDELIQMAKGFDGVYLAGDDCFTKKVLKNSKRLEIISFGGTGYETFIDEDEATKQRIAIANTPGANSRSVAQFAIGLFFALQRKIVFTNNELKEKGLRHRKTTHDLKSLKIGILGMGQIAQNLAFMLKNGFQSDVYYHNRTKKNDLEKQLDIKYLSFDDLLKNCDVIFVTITGKKETMNYIGEQELGLMKKDAYLINIARPNIINPNALFNALKDDKIKGCAIDRYYCPPKKDEYGLLSLGDDKFICTPHIAAKTIEAWDNTDYMAIKNIVDFFENKKCENIKNF